MMQQAVFKIALALCLSMAVSECSGESCSAETTGMSMLQTRNENLAKVMVHDDSKLDDTQSMEQEESASDVGADEDEEDKEDEGEGEDVEDGEEQEDVDEEDEEDEENEEDEEGEEDEEDEDQENGDEDEAEDGSHETELLEASRRRRRRRRRRSEVTSNPCGEGYEWKGSDREYEYCSNYKQGAPASTEHAVADGEAGAAECKALCDKDPTCKVYGKYGVLCARKDGKPNTLCLTKWKTKCFTIRDCGSAKKSKAMSKYGAIYCLKKGAKWPKPVATKPLSGPSTPGAVPWKAKKYSGSGKPNWCRTDTRHLMCPTPIATGVQYAETGQGACILGVGSSLTITNDTAGDPTHSGRAGTPPPLVGNKPQTVKTEGECRHLCNANKKCGGYDMSKGSRICKNYLSGPNVPLIGDLKAHTNKGSRCRVKLADTGPYTGKYANLGIQSCQVRGGTLGEKFYPKAGDAKCKDYCNANDECGGYTVSKFDGNCMLWLRPRGLPLEGGGKWHKQVPGGTCMVKILPGQVLFKSRTTVVGGDGDDETKDWDDMHSFRRRRSVTQKCEDGVDGCVDAAPDTGRKRRRKGGGGRKSGGRKSGGRKRRRKGGR